MLVDDDSSLSLVPWLVVFGVRSPRSELFVVADRDASLSMVLFPPRLRDLSKIEVATLDG